MKIIVTLVTLLAAGLARAESPADAARQSLTQAKLALELGNTAEAERLLGAIAQDPAAPAELRCEALVRQGGAAAASGRTARANGHYMAASQTCADQVEAMRLMVEAITGIEQDPATWRGRTERVRVVIAQDRPLLFFGDTPMPTAEPMPAPEQSALTGARPISISVRDERLADFLRTFSLLSGQDVRLEATEAAERLVTLRFESTPWDQVLALVAGTYGLRPEQDARGVRLIANEFAKATGDEALLQTVRLCFQILQQQGGSVPLETEWTPVGKHASLVEPAYVRFLPRRNLIGAPVLYRSTDGKSFDLRMGAPPAE